MSLTENTITNSKQDISNTNNTVNDKVTCDNDLSTMRDNLSIKDTKIGNHQDIIIKKIKKLTKELDENGLFIITQCFHYNNIFIVYIQIIPINKELFSSEKLNDFEKKLGEESYITGLFTNWIQKTRDKSREYMNDEDFQKRFTTLKIKKFINKVPDCFLSNNISTRHLFETSVEKGENFSCNITFNIVSGWCNKIVDLDLLFNNKKYNISDKELINPNESITRPILKNILELSEKETTSYGYSTQCYKKQLNGWGTSSTFGRNTVSTDGASRNFNIGIRRNHYILKDNIKLIGQILNDLI